MDKDTLEAFENAQVVGQPPTTCEVSLGNMHVVLHALIEQMIYSQGGAFYLRRAESIAAQLSNQLPLHTVEISEWSGGWAAMRDACRHKFQRDGRFADMDREFVPFTKERYLEIDKMLESCQKTAETQEAARRTR